MAEEYKNIDEMTFRDASVELEQIVRTLENGDLELEEALKRYARGVDLLAALRERLNNAEQQVQVLVASLDDDTPVVDTTSAPATAFIDEQ